jgi:uncharacterized NAD(P)/FAD-binding protein YdhS
LSGSAAVLRVAILGCGPKGLYALERLVAIAGNHPRARIAVDVYEPHPAPGAGPVYDPAQPDYLRMNFAAELVDMWPDGSRQGPSFQEWAADKPDVSEEGYPPRAQVGRYLAEGYDSVLNRAPHEMNVTRIAETAIGINRSSNGWKVLASADREYDEVLIATGHEGYAVFPVEQRLSPSEVPPGSVVAIRGFALTMIDAALALTEGRGGTFRPGHEPYLFRYEGGDDDVACILPYSRTGRPMLAKPDPRSGFSSNRLDEIAAAGRARLASLPEGAELEAVVPVVAEVAAESLRDVSGSGAEASAIAVRVESASAGKATSRGLFPAQEIERSIAVGVGQGEPGADWALGHAWRAIYPALVERLGANGLDDKEWPAFRRLAREMERISFGPPPVNAAKLLALIESGKVELSSLTSGPAARADVVIDAVIPPPGVLGLDNALLDGLLDDGHLRIAPGRRGLELSRDVTCVGADGKPRTGLGAIGRATEDWVIGNDTLNRALHPQAERWAKRVVARAANA